MINNYCLKVNKPTELKFKRKKNKYFIGEKEYFYIIKKCFYYTDENDFDVYLSVIKSKVIEKILNEADYTQSFKIKKFLIQKIDEKTFLVSKGSFLKQYNSVKDLVYSEVFS